MANSNTRMREPALNCDGVRVGYFGFIEDMSKNMINSDPALHEKGHMCSSQHPKSEEEEAAVAEDGPSVGVLTQQLGCSHHWIRLERPTNPTLRVRDVSGLPAKRQRQGCWGRVNFTCLDSEVAGRGSTAQE
ncbi:hypothetical protein CBL_07900 [Carabus blaptoides fortunei]